jgi:hypothetical protein
MKNVTSKEFLQIKVWLRVLGVYRTARKFDRSTSTILDVRGCRSYKEYQEKVKSDHPESKEPTIADIVLATHRLVFDKEDYVYPTARVAARELYDRAKKS